MSKNRFEHPRVNGRAISNLAIILVVIAVVGSVVVGVALLLRFWPAQRYASWPRVVGSGRLDTQEKDFSDFTAIDVRDAFDVQITKSSSYSLSITADDNLFDYIEVSKTGDTLEIGLEWGYNYQSVILRAEITMPELYELEFSGATHGTIVGFSSSHEFALVLSGASSLHMGDISVGDVEADISGASLLNGNLTAKGDATFVLSGASTVELTGEADDLVATVSGASHLELSEFPVHNAIINLSGASHSTVNLNGRLDAVVSGASHLLYIGNPTMGDIVTSDVSTVKEKT